MSSTGAAVVRRVREILYGRSEMPENGYVERTIKPRPLEDKEVIEGKLTAIQDGKLSRILVLELPGGRTERLWSSTVLDNALTPADVGRMIKIESLGKVKTKAGREVKDFRVFVKVTAAQAEDAPDPDIPF